MSEKVPTGVAAATGELETLLAQETEVQFEAFDDAAAWNLGLLMATRALERGLKIAIDIRRGDRIMFHASLPGACADNDTWIERKVRSVQRWGHSSFYLGRMLAASGKTLSERYYVSELEYASHGGCFPILVRGTGMIGTAAVSGLPQEEDHRFVVECLKSVMAGTAR